LENKRHLETVTALLQRLVYEKQGYPRFKNWAEICKLGEVDRMLMMAIATIDLDANGIHVHQLISAFPQCFSDEKVSGPIPLSVIRRTAQMNYSGDPAFQHECGDYPVSHRGVPDWVPVVTYDKSGRNVVGSNQPRLPTEIDPNAKQGGIVTWGGRKFVVLENNEECDELSIAPTECIDVNL
jgi:hypothetical protein